MQIDLKIIIHKIFFKLVQCLASDALLLAAEVTQLQLWSWAHEKSIVDCLCYYKNVCFHKHTHVHVLMEHESKPMILS